MALDSSTHKMLAALEETKPAQQFLRNTFFTEPEQSTTEKVDLDVLQGVRKMAPFVSPLSKSKIDLRVDGTTATVKPPYIKMMRPITAADLQKRMPGEDPFNPAPLDQKLLMLQTRDNAEMRDRIYRREEWMCAKQLTTGEVHIVGEGVDATITLPMLATHKLADTDLVAGGWDQNNANPIKDLIKIRKLVTRDSGLNADFALFGANAWDLFWSNSAVQNYIDKMKLNILQGGQLTVMGPSVGANFHGEIEGLRLFTYNEWFVDDDPGGSGIEEPMVPDDTLVIASTAMRCLRKYGAIMDLRSLMAVDIFPKYWEEQDPSVGYVQLQSAPLPWVVQVNGFAFADVQ